MCSTVNLCSDALFREDTMVCTLASSFLKSAGAAYLQKILGPPISKIAQSKKSFEVLFTCNHKK